MSKKRKEKLEHLKIDVENELAKQNRRSWEPSEGRMDQMASEQKTQVSRRLGWPSRNF